MRIGDVIRKHRKDRNITQSEMANRLGVTAPAVNKWENGNSLPDVALLSPIARLLNISVDTLLSHEQELSDAEANRLVEKAIDRFKKEPFDTVFQWIKRCIAAYPNSHFLILWMARAVDSHREMAKVPSEEQHDEYILDCYQRVLESDDSGLKIAAAESLYYFHMNREQYQQAEAYLAYFSKENPERKRKQAIICGETGREREAYKMHEELLYASYQSVNRTFHDIYLLALKENDFEKAHLLVGKMRVLTELFEFGDYHSASAGLELAMLEKNVSETLHIVERMLGHFDSVFGFTKSPLYAHMAFTKPDASFLSEMKEDILKELREGKTGEFLAGNQKWRTLVGLPKPTE